MEFGKPTPRNAVRGRYPRWSAYAVFHGHCFAIADPQSLVPRP
jgi:hypothetical protein